MKMKLGVGHFPASMSDAYLELYQTSINAILQKQLTVINCFRKNALSWMFDRVLSTPLDLPYR